MMVTNFALIVLLLWAGSVPVVIPKHYGHMNRKFWGQSVCNKYTLPVNTMWTLRARCEDTKRFQCQPGYQSRVQTTCRNGLWYTEPTCQGQCMSDPVILNGTINTEITSRDIGQQYYFTCQEPFTDIGTEGVVTCKANGEWEANITCKGQCMSDPVILNGTINTNITSRDIGQQYDFTCQEPFTDIGTEGVVTCKANGEWEANITCFIIKKNIHCLKIQETSFINTGEYYTGFEISGCNETCEETQCGYIAYLPTFCAMYKQPLIFADFSKRFSQVDCVQKCKELNECITMSYRIDNRECMLLNATLEEIPSKNIEPGDGEIIQYKC